MFCLFDNGFRFDESDWIVESIEREISDRKRTRDINQSLVVGDAFLEIDLICFFCRHFTSIIIVADLLRRFNCENIHQTAHRKMTHIFRQRSIRSARQFKRSYLSSCARSTPRASRWTCSKAESSRRLTIINADERAYRVVDNDDHYSG